MKIEIVINRCFHCEHFTYDDEDNIEEVGKISCSITNQKINDNTPACDKFKLSRFVAQELNKSLGFREADMEFIRIV